MKGKLANYFIFDIGSNKIAAIAVNINKMQESKVLAEVFQSSCGFRGSTVINLEDAENSIITAVYSLEKECKKTINGITISLSSGFKSYYVKNTIKLNNQPINKQNIKRLIQKSLANFSFKNEEIIHYFPIEFTLDNNKIIEDPDGMYAKELTCQLHIVAVNSFILRNITNCFARCNIEVNDVVLSIYADGLACLSDEERETGTFIINIGSHITNFGIFFEGKIIYAGHVPIASYHITSDIAKHLSLSIEAAEKLKILYGDVRPELFNKDESIRIDISEPDNNYNNTNSVIPIHKLAKIIKSRVDEILDFIKREYDNLGIDDLIARRIVLTGGGSNLHGIKNLTAETFQKQVRIARLENISTFTNNVSNNPVYSTVIGMLEAKIIQHKINSLRIDKKERLRWIKKMFLWFKENL